MKTNQMSLIKTYLENLQVSVLLCDFTHVAPDWRDIDYTPDYNKLYLIVSGEGWLKIGEREFTPCAGQLVLMPAGVKQSYSAMSEDTYQKYWCHFSAKVGGMNLFDLIILPFISETKGENYPSAVFRELIESASSADMTAPLTMKTSILRLITYYIEINKGQIN